MDRKLDSATSSRLQELESSRFTVLSKTNRQMALLVELGSSASPGALPLVVDWTLHSDRGIRFVAMKAVRQLLGRLPVREIPWLDQLIRSRWCEAPRKWRKLKIRSLKGRNPKDRAALLRLASMHPSGYVREAAIIAMNEHPAADDLPFLAVRASDWVEPVRRLAYDSIRRRLVPEFLPVLVQSLPLLQGLQVRKRFDAAELMPDVEQSLDCEAGHRLLRSALNSEELGIRRCAFELGARLCLDEGFLRSALDSSDQMVRLRAARRVLSGDWEALASKLLDSLASDAYPAIRRLALESCGRFDSDGGLCRFEAGALDTSRSIRELCQQALMFEFDRDVVEIYSEILRRKQAEEGEPPTQRLVASLDGLREMGGAEDALLAETYLEHRSPSVRAAALRLLTRFDAASHTSIAFKALRDPSPSVCRAAIQIVEKNRLPLHIDSLRNLFWQSDVANQPALLRLFRLQDFWVHLCGLLEASRHPEEHLRDMARARLWRHLHSGHYMPDPQPEQLARLREETQLSHESLPASLISHVEFIARLAEDRPTRSLSRESDASG